MSSPSRTRARKSTPAKKAAAKPKEQPDITQEEADLAAAQEQAEFLQGQVNVLQGRVVLLRAQLNRALANLEGLRGPDEG